MNLKKLFEMQQVLKDHIGYKGKDRLNKLILALLVELGECANEWRGFKFWSKDQEPRKQKVTYPYQTGREFHGPVVKVTNPLLEEYVDGLHFVLEFGLMIGRNDFTYLDTHVSEKPTIEEQFIYVKEIAILLKYDDYYNELFESFIDLGFMLGFTWEQIEQAYISKNEVNHQRQDAGY